ncbi:hypothetical protein [Angustibacter sp. Root456]|uniref:hypothetical protein n=1 Tax=Angustibacter sp. Root456 TaxID=1736539 RepID=UPI0006F5FCAA|nr:hypothetical protein [Angustibacter sp. Root456]KQX62902.1 hypothetical protein ASD06_12875 [Angustibacter sp. Root456]
MSTPRQRVRLYGLLVESELDLHQDRLVDGGGAPDVVLEWGEDLADNREPPPGRVLLHHELAPGVAYTFAQGDDGSCVLRFAGACDFVVDPTLSRVSAHVVDGCEPEFASVLASGAVLSFLLLMRGELVLHASAVEVDESALAFIGYSGMGKSTMAALVAAEGGRLVTDDVLRVQLDPDAARCYLGATELRLRKAATELAERFGDRPARRTTSDQRDALRLTGASMERLPLTAVVVPRPRRDVDELAVTRLTGGEALLSLVRYPRLLGWQDERVQAEQFSHLARLCELVPIYVADVPWGPPFSPDLGVRLLDAVGMCQSPAGRT